LGVSVWEFRVGRLRLTWFGYGIRSANCWNTVKLSDDQLSKTMKQATDKESSLSSSECDVGYERDEVDFFSFSFIGSGSRSPVAGIGGREAQR
jgi:hypothetical protein